MCKEPQDLPGLQDPEGIVDHRDHLGVLVVLELKDQQVIQVLEEILVHQAL